jgi:sterol desaturase/sphingolipid hydroxylase (fatty acid hydroxylase superfamily)
MLAYIFAFAIGCFVLERVVPGWRLPTVRTWPFRVVAINLAQLAVVLLAGYTWERWFSSASLFNLSARFNPVVGGLLAYFVATFVFYWWHRWRHEVNVLWRFFHQIHHSAQRIEVITSFYKHPVEMVVNSLIGSFLVYTVLGLSVEAGAVYTACTAIGEFVYHTNMRSPRWMGYFFQRPEMHRIHHQYGRHKNNYGDIVWWDMLFGTYENPRDFAATCGFDDMREQRLGDMLLYRDVHDT